MALTINMPKQGSVGNHPYRIIHKKGEFDGDDDDAVETVVKWFTEEDVNSPMLAPHCYGYSNQSETTCTCLHAVSNAVPAIMQC